MKENEVQSTGYDIILSEAHPVLFTLKNNANRRNGNY